MGTHTLIDFADALASGLASRLSDVPTITADRPTRHQRSLRVPAVFLELEDMEPMQEAGDSRLLVDVRWVAHCLVDPNQPRAELLLRALAARVAVALHEIRRPVAEHGHVRLARAGESAFAPDLDGYLCWDVEFGIETALGALDTAGIIPSTIYISQPPTSGADHADDYERIA